MTAQTPAPNDADSGPLDIAALFSLAGEVAVIADHRATGGLEMARLLLSAGASVILLDIDPAALEVAETALAFASERFSTAQVDIRQEGEVVAAFGEIAAVWGRVDILVNLAGGIANQPFTETTAADWDFNFELNTRAPFLCMREAIKLMVETGTRGRIVNVTTIGAVVPVMNGNAAYGASRAAVNMLSKSVALDYAPHGIRINCVLPGAILGKVIMYEGHGDRAPDGPILRPGRLPFGYGAMRDVTTAILFLVSPASAYVTGQALAVDGGFLVT